MKHHRRFASIAVLSLDSLSDRDQYTICNLRRVANSCAVSLVGGWIMQGESMFESGAGIDAAPMWAPGTQAQSENGELN